jgi:tricorn protease
MPVEHGPVRSISGGDGGHERGPAWSPDGQSIASFRFGGAGEDSCLLIRPQVGGTGAAAAVAIPLGPNYFYHAVWSPDSKMIALVDKSMAVYTVDLEDNNRALRLVAADTNDPSMG